jgi:multidrug efflux pump subunit AcrB
MEGGISAPFIRLPIATSLLMVGVLFVGLVAYPRLPVAPLPQVDFPTIQVNATLPGASPDTMASAVAQPLETQFAQIAGVSQMTSTSVVGSTSITIQFVLERNIDAAANDVQAAINAAGGQLPPLSIATVDNPKGSIRGEKRAFTIYTNDQLPNSKDWNDVIVAYRTGAPLRVRDIGQAVTGPQDTTQAGWADGKRGIVLVIFKQPGANVIDTVDKINAALPKLRATMPPAINVFTLSDRTQTIRASVADVFHPSHHDPACGDGHLRLPAQLLGNHHSQCHRAAVVARRLRPDVAFRLQPR